MTHAERELAEIIARAVWRRLRQEGPVSSDGTDWITLEKYCQATGETPGAVRKRRQKGIWLDGRHTRVRNRRLWVNKKAAQEWVVKGS